ncbi:MAG: S-formylglutathione hydrolase [Cyanobacteria bacterium J06641_5]
MSAKLELRSEHLCFGGKVGYYSHQSDRCNGEMRFATFVPPQAATGPVPVVYFLSGLTCTEENFTVKAGAQRWAAELGLMLVVPDTSPRQTGISDEDKDYDLGSGAGFYVDATAEPWQLFYQMYSYVTAELPEIIATHFPSIPEKSGICGHSMGGHGALICALKNPDRYRSVSAFAPIAAPSQCPWGNKALENYLGRDRAAWRAYDASELVKQTQLQSTILIDQGEADPFLAQKQLLPDVFANACTEAGQALQLRYQPGYDHGYFFIASFIADHLHHHAAALQ